MMRKCRNSNFEGNDSANLRELNCVFVFLYFIYIYKGWGETPLAMQFQRSEQLVCKFKGTYRCFCVFIFYLYLQGVGGDSSVNAIPEE